jgi:hypothetical protein
MFSKNHLFSKEVIKNTSSSIIMSVITVKSRVN